MPMQSNLLMLMSIKIMPLQLQMMVNSTNGVSMLLVVVELEIVTKMFFLSNSGSQRRLNISMSTLSNKLQLVRVILLFSQHWEQIWTKIKYLHMEEKIIMVIILPALLLKLKRKTILSSILRDLIISKCTKLKLEQNALLFAAKERKIYSLIDTNTNKQNVVSV